MTAPANKKYIALPKHNSMETRLPLSPLNYAWVRPCTFCWQEPSRRGVLPSQNRMFTWMQCARLSLLVLQKEQALSQLFELAVLYYSSCQLQLQPLNYLHQQFLSFTESDFVWHLNAIQILAVIFLFMVSTYLNLVMGSAVHESASAVPCPHLPQINFFSIPTLKSSKEVYYKYAPDL